MPRFVFEDYVNPEDKNGNGTVKYNVDTSYATHRVSKAIRDNIITGTPGWSWNDSLVEFESNIYSWHKTANFTNLANVEFHAARGPMSIYSTANWTSNGKWRNGKLDDTGVEVPAGACPQLDFTDSSGLTFSGGIRVQSQKLLGPPNEMPNSIPGGGMLFTMTEKAQYSASRGQYYDGTGANRTSDGCTLTGVSLTGFWSYAGLGMFNSVIHEINEGGASIAGPNSSTPRAVWLGRELPGNYQSPFYPVMNLSTDERRTCMTPVCAGAVVLDGFEVHSLIKDTFPSAGNSNLAAPVLLDRVTQFDVRGKPFGSDGLAIVEVQKFARLISFRGIEFWNADRYGNSQPTCIVFLNGTSYHPNNATEPVQGLSFHDCVINSGYQALIRGVNNSALDGLWLGPNNYSRPDIPILDLSIGYNAGANTYPLTNSTIYCKGAPVKVGGSLNNTVRLADPGAVTVQGTDNARRI